MKKQYLILAMALLVFLPLAISEIQNLGVFKIDECINLKQLGAGFDNCTITTVQRPDSLVYNISAFMTKDNVEYNYSFCNTSIVGTYISNGFCSETSGDVVWNYNFEITQTGKSQQNWMTLIIGIAVLMILFIVLTIWSVDNHPFLANFFFLMTFWFATIDTNLLWRIAYDNSYFYQGIMLIVYRMMMIISMTLTFIILVILTIDVVQIRRIKGNPIDSYRDNLGKNE